MSSEPQEELVVSDAGTSPATTPTPSVSSTDSGAAHSDVSPVNASNVYVESNGHHSQADEDSMNNNGGTTVVVTDPSASSGQNFVVSGTAPSGTYPQTLPVNRPNNRRSHTHAGRNSQRSASPNRMPHSYSPNRNSTDAAAAAADANTPSQHVVHVHINPGETFSVRVGDQMQHIQGPATVRMVSNNGPPMPMPMQVPPGHMVQQIVDENGYLTHVILSPQPAGMPTPQSVGYYGGANGTPQQLYPTYGAPQYAAAAAAAYTPQYSHHHAATATHMATQHAASTQCNNHVYSAVAGGGDERTSRTKQRLQQKLTKRANDEYYVQPPPRPNNKTKMNGESVRSADQCSSSSSVDGLELEEEQRALAASLTQIDRPKVSDLEACSALVKLTSPSFDQLSVDVASDVFNYELYISDKKEGKYKSVYSGTANEITLKDLKPATEYHLRVRCIYEEVKGEQTEAVSFKTHCSVPDAPSSLKLSNRSKTALLLKWNAACDNGSKILHYLLETSSNTSDNYTKVYQGSARQFKVNKLNASSRYWFRIAAVNAIGKSVYSDAVYYYTTGSAPSQPDPPMLSEQFVKALRISWIRRTNDDEFTLQMEDDATGHGFLTVYNGPDLSYKIMNLRRNTEYKFRLQANNDEGSSKFSDSVNYRTLPDVPSAPAKLTHKGRIHPQSFRVTWDTPKDSGGCEINKYSVQLDEGNGYELVYEGDERECVCERLQPGQQYRVRVAAYSQGGCSDWCDPLVVSTLAVPPGIIQPPKQHGKPKSTSMHLKWNYPEYDGGAAVTEFEVRLTTGENVCRSVYRGRELDCVVAGLLPGRPYMFNVRAINGTGAGPWSELAEIASGAGVPDPPSAPAVTFKSSHNAVVAWHEPHNNGAPVLEYNLEWHANCDGVLTSSFSQLYCGSNMQYELRNLTADTNYAFRVQAVNSAGAGPYSAVAACQTPPTSPAAVAGVRTSASATSIHVTWKAPACNGSPILTYNIDLGERHLITVDGSTTDADITDLMPETTYKLRVQAVNSIGVGGLSSVIKVTTRPLPPAPPRLECLSTAPNSLKLKWGDGRNPDLLHYCLELMKENGSFYPVYHGTNQQQKLNKLQELRDHQFRIYARNDAGEGPYSEVYTFRTTKALPPAVKLPRVSDMTLDSALIEWTAVRPMASDTITYCLQVATRDQDYKKVYSGRALSYRLSGLQMRCEYQARVCAVRQSSTECLTGAFSPGMRFTCPSAASSTTVPKLAVAASAERKKLTDQQWAVIILLVFAVVAVLIALLVQKIVAYRSAGADTSSGSAGSQ